MLAMLVIIIIINNPLSGKTDRGLFVANILIY